MKNIDAVIEVLGNLKNLKRTGWVRNNVTDAESVADHTFGTTFLVLMLALEHLNLEKCLKLSLIHDLAEIYVGDITPFDGVDENDKQKQEMAVMNLLEEKLNFPNLVALFYEYEQAETHEARFVRNIDKLESAFQAVFYYQHQKIEKGTALEFLDTAQRRSLLNSHDDEFLVLYNQLRQFVENN